METILAHSSIESFWSPPRVIHLRELFDRGLSSQQIATEMNIRSRSAVIGKLHRLGLKRNGESRARAARVSPPTRLRAVAVPTPARPAPMVANPALDCDGVTDLAIETGANRVPLLSARKDQCRWPAADDGSANLVCGNITAAGSYCAHHALRSVLRPGASRTTGFAAV